MVSLHSWSLATFPDSFLKRNVHTSKMLLTPVKPDTKVESLRAWMLLIRDRLKVGICDRS